jgi:SAM-dependent MidA family methyltransferase
MSSSSELEKSSMISTGRCMFINGIFFTGELFDVNDVWIIVADELWWLEQMASLTSEAWGPVPKISHQK